MSRKLVFLMALLVLTGIFSVVIKLTRVKASGIIYIRANGSIDPSTANITTTDKITYTFTGNITDEIVVERSNTIIDGKGYAVEGAGVDTSGTGIYLSSRSNVTIQNTNVKDFRFGITLFSSSNNSIVGNSITNNMYDITLSSSSNNSIVGNSITNSYDGIMLFSSSNNSIVGNSITNNRYGIRLSLFSSNNSVVGNNITANSHHGIYLYKSSNNSISGNNIKNNRHGIELGSSSNNSIVGNTFFACGLCVFFSFGDVVVDNLVNGKPLVYLEGVSDYVVEEAGQVILTNCNRIKVQNLNLSHTTIGVQMWNTTNTEIVGNNITNNYHGIALYYSSNNTVYGNNIKNNNWSGISLYLSSNNNTVYGNNIKNNKRGIQLSYSSNNSIYGNNINRNGKGCFCEADSYNNEIFRNNFINNAGQVDSYDSVNIWDNGCEGNYWSDYNGIDSDYDGIGNTPYIIDATNKDYYPLMGIFSDFNITLEHHVQTICNSSITDFQFDGIAILFNVSGANGTAGFCRICIPKALMNETYRVFVNGTEILPAPLPLPCSNITHNYIYFNYTHSIQEVVIIPEFPSLILLPLFMTATLLAAIIHRRKRTR